MTLSHVRQHMTAWPCGAAPLLGRRRGWRRRYSVRHQPSHRRWSRWYLRSTL